MNSSKEYLDTKFLIDTSVFYSLSHQNMHSLFDQGISLFASPYACWELLCHLDEPSMFLRMKAILLKFQYVNILDDPFAEIEYSLYDGNNDRITETDLIKACLAALQHADSLKTFYSSLIRDTKNNYRQIEDVSIRARDILSKSEIRYTEFAEKVMSYFRTLHSLNDSTSYQRMILSFVLGEYKKLEERHPDATISEREVIRRYYIYCGYIFYRCLRRAKDGGRISKNDFEMRTFACI